MFVICLNKRIIFFYTSHENKWILRKILKNKQKRADMWRLKPTCMCIFHIWIVIITMWSVWLSVRGKCVSEQGGRDDDRETREQWHEDDAEEFEQREEKCMNEAERENWNEWCVCVSERNRMVKQRKDSCFGSGWNQMQEIESLIKLLRCQCVYLFLI